MDKILPNFCNVSIIERFTLSLDPILILLPRLIIFRQKSGGLCPCHPGSPTYACMWLLNVNFLSGNATRQWRLLAVSHTHVYLVKRSMSESVAMFPQVYSLGYSLGHVDHSLTLIMDITNFWNHCYSFTHASFGTVYNYTWFTAISSATVSLHHLPRQLSVFNSHMQGSHSVISDFK